MITRENIIDFILDEEGGLVDNPADPGGRTNHGITQRYLDAARLRHPELSLPMKVDDLQAPLAAWVYRLDQWSEIQGEALPPGLAVLVMDCAVNSGPSEAVRLLQETLGIHADGIMGPSTIYAVHSVQHPIQLIIDDYAAHRGSFYAKLDPNENTFELGWMRRLMRAHRLAVQASTP